MNRFLLEMFTVVVETKRITAAAKLLNLTQPAVSQQIRSMEEYFGRQLLTRGPQGAIPTPAGEILYRNAKEILAQYDRMEREIDELSDAEELEIVIGATPTIGNFALPCSLWTFKERFPKVNIRLEVGSCTEMADRLLERSVHMAIVEGPVPERAANAQGLKWRTICGDHVILVTPSGGKYDQERLTLETLQQVPLILPGRLMGMWKVFDTAIQAYGLGIKELQVLSQLGGLEGMKAVLDTRGGVMLCTRMAVQRELRQGVYTDVTPENLEVPIPFNLICFEETLPGVAHRFIRFIAAPEELASCWT